MNDILALRYKVWACPIPGVEKGVAFDLKAPPRGGLQGGELK